MEQKFKKIETKKILKLLQVLLQKVNKLMW